MCDSENKIYMLHYRMPILYSNISAGRFFCALFFACISLAGFSSLVSLMERTIRVVIDFGSMYNNMWSLRYFVNIVRRVPAIIIVGLVTFFVGLGSALTLDMLINQVYKYYNVAYMHAYHNIHDYRAIQDKVWGYALLISGLIYVYMVYRVGGERYRNEIVNKVKMYCYNNIKHCNTKYNTNMWSRDK